jgi:hypothetical protein
MAIPRRQGATSYLEIRGASPCAVRSHDATQHNKGIPLKLERIPKHWVQCQPSHGERHPRWGENRPETDRRAGCSPFDAAVDLLRERFNRVNTMVRSGIPITRAPYHPMVEPVETAEEMTVAWRTAFPIPCRKFGVRITREKSKTEPPGPRAYRRPACTSRFSAKSS